MSAGKRKRLTKKILHLTPNRLLQHDFTIGAQNTHRYIGNIVTSKIVISGFCFICFTLTFVGAYLHIYRYTGGCRYIEDRCIGVPL